MKWKRIMEILLRILWMLAPPPTVESCFLRGARAELGEQPLASPGRDQREQPFRTVQNPSEPTSDLEERVRADCRRSCRRNFWIELFKSAAKIAGVVLAALGLSSFNEEN